MKIIMMIFFYYWSHKIIIESSTIGLLLRYTFHYHWHLYWFAFEITSFSNTLSLNLVCPEAAMSPAQLNSRSTAVD